MENGTVLWSTSGRKVYQSWYPQLVFEVTILYYTLKALDNSHSPFITPLEYSLKLVLSLYAEYVIERDGRRQGIVLCIWWDGISGVQRTTPEALGPLNYVGHGSCLFQFAAFVSRFPKYSLALVSSSFVLQGRVCGPLSSSAQSSDCS